MPKPASKPTIAVDIDEVLFPMAPTFLSYYNTQHGTNYKLDQMTSYFLEDLTGESTEEMLAKIQAYLKAEIYTQGKPVIGSLGAIHKLREKFKLVVVTSRDHFFRGHTEAFLDSHFSGLYDELHYTHKPDSPDIRTPKYKICQEIKAIALIDDHLSNVVGCAENGIKGILFGDYPWNQTKKLPEGVTRLKNWQEVLEYFYAESR